MSVVLNDFRAGRRADVRGDQSNFLDDRSVAVVDSSSAALWCPETTDDGAAEALAFSAGWR